MLPSYYTISRSMVKIASGEFHGCRVLGLVMEVRVFVAMKNFLCDS
jgi:hypothetical protein